MQLPHIAQRAALKQLDMVLEGFLLSDADINAAVDAYMASFADIVLPAVEMEEILSVLRGRVDGALFAQIQETVETYKAAVEAGTGMLIVTIACIFPFMHIQSCPC